MYPHIHWNTPKNTLSDDAELEPTYTVGPKFGHTDCCWLKLFLALPISFFCLQSFEVFFSKLGPCNTNLSPFQLLSSSKFCCTWISFMWEQMQMTRENLINKIYRIPWQTFLFLVWNIVIDKLMKMLYELCSQCFLQLFLHLIPLSKLIKCLFKLDWILYVTV